MKVGRFSTLAMALQGIAPLVLWGCFDGADALGLPCEKDADCGRSQTCDAGFCGGPPATSGAATQGTGNGSSSMGSTSATDSTGISDTVGSTGIAAGCGNGIREDDEQCDPGPEDAVDCDADCTLVECGDGHPNAAAGESCDPPGGTTCTPACEAVLFFDDMSDEAASRTTYWSQTLPILENLKLGPDTIWATQDKAWRTGAYACESGVADLTTRPFAMAAAPAGQHIELRFRHRHDFDPNPDSFPACVGAPPGDGGLVYIVGAGVDEQIPAIYSGGTLDETSCGAGVANPLGTASAFTRRTTEGNNLVEITASLAAWEGQLDEASIRFRMSYDCANCGYNCQDPGSAPMQYGWWIDDVVVHYVQD